MFDLLLSNLILILILVVMYLGSLGVNTILGLYESLGSMKENFSKEKLFKGLIKGGIVLIGALAVTANISLIPSILTALGITAEAAMFESITVAGMGTVLISATARYLGDAIQKLYNILGVKKGETK